MSHVPRIASNRSAFGFLARAACAVVLIGGGCGRTNDGGQSLTGPSNAVVIATSGLASGVVGTAYSATLQATGGTGNYMWSVVSGSTPAGLTLSSAGVLSGTPTTVETSGFSVQATSGTTTATQAFSVTVTAAVSPLTIITTSLSAGTVATSYSATLQATGGTGNYTWSVVSGSLPAGLTLSTSGLLSGTPTAAATSNFTVQAASGTQTATQALSVTITPGLLVITTTSVPNVFLGTAYSTNLRVTGGIGGATGNYTWSLLSGTMPGLSVYGGGPNGDGIISGTAIATGTYDIVVQVTSGAQTATQALAVFVVASNTPVVITTTSWPAQQVGVYSAQRLTASGGFGTYAWSLVSGSLPVGLALFSDGIIGGTPTTAGTSNFTVQVTSGSSIATQALTVIAYANGSLAISATSLPGGTVGAVYTQTLQATGGTGAYAWSVVSGSLPTGLTLSTAGVLSGTPTTVATSNFTVQVASGTAIATQALSVTVTATVPTLSIMTTSLAGGAVGTTYNQTLQATGGTGIYSWTSVSGSLPTGLALSTSGVLSGTPSSAGSFNFTVQVTSGTQTATQALTVAVTAAVSPLSVTTTNLSSGTVGTSYSATLQATGGSGTYSWSVVSGSIPTGLTLSSAGVLSGTPTSAATSSFTVQVASGAATATQALSVTIAVGSVPTLSITTTSLAGGTVGTAYSQTLQATGGSASYTWSLANGTLPAGLALSSAGALSGTPTSAGTFNFTVQVTSGTTTATQSLSLSVAAGASPVSIVTSSLPDATVGANYFQTLQALGPSGCCSWTIVSGSLPAGIGFDSNGEIDGTPTSTGIGNFVVQATNGAGQSATQALRLTVDSPLAITTSSFSNGVVGSAYASQALQATGGSGNYTWSLVSASGLTLSSAGVLSGTPLLAGTSFLTVQVTSGTSTATRSVALTINASPVVSVTTTSLATANVGKSYLAILQAAGGSGSYAWSVVGGSLPAGLTLSASGFLSGAPAVAGTTGFIVQVTSGSATAVQALSVTVNP